MLAVQPMFEIGSVEVNDAEFGVFRQAFTDH